LAGRASFGALLLICALAPVSALARSGPPGDSELSPRLAELARPAVRSLPPVEQAQQLGLAASGPGSLLRNGNRVLVDVRFDRGALAAVEALRSTGASVLAASGRYQTVTVAIAPGSLPGLAGLTGVEGVSEKRSPLLFGAGDTASTAALGAECEGGAVISEGVEQLQVASARSKYGVDGAGVTVGVLSDSYDQATEAADESGPVATHAADDVASSDLPGVGNPCAGEKTAVNVLQDFGPEASDEGRGMLQIVHDVAPGADLAFATAFQSELSFAQNIERLAQPVSAGGAGAKVIVDDVAWFEEPFFQDGPIAVAVDKVATDGVSYFSAAGNENLFEGGNEIASWEAPGFRDSSSCPAPLTVSHCLDFNPGAATDNAFGLTVSPGATLTIDLQWAEPWFGVKTDLDAFLLDAGGEVIAEEDADNVATTQRPVELLQWENNSGVAKVVRLAVNRCSGACNPAASGTATPVVKFALLGNGGGVTKTEYPVSTGGDTVGPTIFGHAGASGAVAAAAVPFNNSKQPERYSSRGPVTHYFGPVNGIVPAAALGAPEVIAKPDIAATDCGATTFFASFIAAEDSWRFCGTSAAAPHAAGVAALELDAEPAASVAEVRDAQAGTAVPVGAFGANAVGAGLLDADATVASLLPPAAVTITTHPPSRTADATPSFGFASDEPATFTCSIDGAPAQACESPFTAPGPLLDGPHTFTVNAVEAPSTVLGTASFAFTVDTSPPNVEFSRRPAPISADRRPDFGFASDEPATFTCSIDGAAAQACKSPFAVVGPLPDGSHTFTVTATDQVGNSGPASVEFTVDTVAPVLVFTERPPERSADRTPAFGFVSNEPAAFACSIDAGTPQPCASPTVAPSPLSDGAHGFVVTATDPAGNVSQAATGFSIDTRRPQTFFTAHPRRVLVTHGRRARASFRFGSNEADVTFVCKVDRRLPRFCGRRVSRRFGVGKHLVQVRARDGVGNVDRSPAVFRFRVKRLG
jgi:hypothetical protein